MQAESTTTSSHIIDLFADNPFAICHQQLPAEKSSGTPEPEANQSDDTEDVTVYKGGLNRKPEKRKTHPDVCQRCDSGSVLPAEKFITKRGFVLMQRRWVVERDFAWAARFSRLATDYERLDITLKRPHLLAFPILMLRKLVSTLN